MLPPAEISRTDSDVLKRVLSGDFRTIARLITLVENHAAASVPYLRELYPHTGRATSIGITGSPGSGKSTLVDGLASYYRRGGGRIGIIAVDPTSPYSGGAILGDRIRMQSRSLDPGTFIRSMATRGHLGGLARATNDAITVLDAAGFEIILIETVGVGQDEVEVVRTVETTLVLLVPGMGDDIQAMKAGIMEIGDVFVINKSDLPGADRVEKELKALLSMSRRPDGWTPLIVRTAASEGVGIAECAQAVQSYRAFAKSSREVRALQVQRERVLELARSMAIERLLSDPDAVQRLDVLAQRVAQRDTDPYTAAEELLHAAKLRN